MPNVHFSNWNHTVRAGPLADLRSIARFAGISLYAGAAKRLNCHGKGLCGTCRVKVDPPQALTPPTRRERLRGCGGAMRLACQARLTSDRYDVRVTKLEGFSGKGPVPLAVEGPVARV
jgi:ferredoxin